MVLHPEGRTCLVCFRTGC